MIERRWWILAVLFVARVALGFQFQNVGSLAPFLVRDLGLDYAQLGILVGAFILPGVAISLPSGLLARSFGDKRIVMLGMILMIAGGALAGIGASHQAILMGRVLGGAGGAILIVLMSKMITDWFAGKELFLGMAIFIIGWPVGIAAGQATQSVLAELWSWQAVFNLSAALVAGSLLLTGVFYDRPPEQRPIPPAARPELGRSEIAMVCLVGIIWMFLNTGYVVMLSFAPAQLVDGGMSITRADAVASLMSWVFIFALPLGGHLAHRYRIADPIMFGGMAATVVLGAIVPFSPFPVVTYALFGTALALATPIVSALPAEVMEPHNRGPGFGIYYLWYFGGLPVLIAAAGFARDLTGSASAPLIFATSMMLCCLALLGMLRLTQRRALGLSARP
jgi:MFS family permease